MDGLWGEGDIQSPKALFVEMAASKMKETAFKLTPEDRETVEQTINRHCKIRGWKLHAVNARSNHVHAVVTAPEYNQRTVHNQLKAWCTRFLKQRHPNRKRFWTEGGSCRSINQEDALDSAIVYVNDAQDRKGVESNEAQA